MDTIDTCCYRPGRFLAPNWLYPPFVFFPLQINLRAPWGFSPLNLSFWKVKLPFSLRMDRQPQGKNHGNSAGFLSMILAQFNQVAPLPYTLQQNTGTRWCCGLLLKDGVIKDAVMAAGFLKRSKPWNVFTSQILGIWGQYMESWWKSMGFHGGI